MEGTKFNHKELSLYVITEIHRLLEEMGIIEIDPLLLNPSFMNLVFKDNDLVKGCQFLEEFVEFFSLTEEEIQDYLYSITELQRPY